MLGPMRNYECKSKVLGEKTTLYGK
jgi:hypothetical protein